MGATPSGLAQQPTSETLFFTSDVVPAIALPLYHGLGHALNVLACAPNGVVDQRQKPDSRPVNTGSPVKTAVNMEVGICALCAAVI